MEEATFRYPWFYKLHLIAGAVFVATLFGIFLYWQREFLDQQPIPLAIMFCFVVYVTVDCVRIARKRYRDRVDITVSRKAVTARYRDGWITEIPWSAIGSVQINQDPKRIACEIIEITSREGLERITCNNELRKYQDFKSIVEQRSPHR